MTLDTRKPRCLPTGINPPIFCNNIASNGSALPGFTAMKLEKAYEAECKPHAFHSPFKVLFSAGNQHFQEQQSTFDNGHSGIAAKLHEAFGSSHKNLLIFDQSGNGTPLTRFLFSPQHLSTDVAQPGRLPHLCDVEKVQKTTRFISEDVLLRDNFDENHVNGEELEMHEDTEEINALLYSDEDDDYCDSDDEVMSTGRSPFPVDKICNKHKFEEFDSADADGPYKRQKMLDGWYNKSSLVDTASSVKPEESYHHKYENIPESSYAGAHEMGSGLCNNRSRKEKIGIALRILKCIVPNSKGKEAMLVLDEAIDYLNLLKQKAKSLGVNPTSKPCD